PLIEAALRDELASASARTLRYRFQHSTGLGQHHIRQIKRAHRAVDLLHQGKSILETAYELGYADQSHLTRSLKRFLGYTPRELVASAPILIRTCVQQAATSGKFRCSCFVAVRHCTGP